MLAYTRYTLLSCFLNADYISHPILYLKRFDNVEIIESQCPQRLDHAIRPPVVQTAYVER